MNRSVLYASQCLFIATVIALAGCGINTRTPDGELIRMTEEEFAEYVERVFRHHNGVVNELILSSSLSDDPAQEFPPELLRAEEIMVRQCQPLNEMVSATIEGREISLWSKMLLMDQVPKCAQSSKRVEQLIPEVF